MYEIEILLKQRATSSEDSAGWFLASEEPNQIVAALLEQGSQDFESGFAYLVPRSANDANKAGVVFLKISGSKLCKLPVGAVPLQKLRVSTKCQVEFWIPQNAFLDPGPSLEKMGQLLKCYSLETLLWLPSCGLVGFEAEDRIEFAQLVSPPKRNDSQIEFVAPPITPKSIRRISSYALENPPTLDELFAQEQADIGGIQMQLGDDAVDSDEKHGSRTMQKWQQSFLKQLERIANKLKQWSERDQRKRNPQNSPKRTSGSERVRSPSVWGSLADAAASTVGNMASAAGRFLSQPIQRKRDEQIEKLLRLFERDPDRALKYAIPMTENAQGRGAGQASNQLSKRTPDFSLTGLFGGGQPTDHWDMDYRLRQKLQQSYREQANREQALGRYRRAAYIFAHLLGDLNAAAKALEKGQSFGEAAVLYKRLGDNRKQASCLALAGRTQEAAEIYEGLGDYLASGELWEEVNNPILAREAFEKAIANAMRNDDPVTAAKLTDQKLLDREAGLGILSQAWPHSNRAFDAMCLAFHWHAQGGHHEAAREQLVELRDLAGDSNYTLLAKTSAQVATDYPDRNIQQLAEDQCRLAVSGDSGKIPHEELLQRMSYLKRLAVHDELLNEDVARFRNITPTQPVSHQVSTLAHRKQLQLCEMDVTQGDRLIQLDCHQSELFALSCMGGNLCAHSVTNLTGRTPQIQAKILKEEWNASLPVVAYRLPHSSMRVYSLACPLASFDFQVDLMRCDKGRDCYISPKEKLSADCAAAGPDGSVWSVSRLDSRVSMRCERDGETILTDLSELCSIAWFTGIPEDALHVEVSFEPVKLVAMGRRPVFSINQFVCSLEKDKPAIGFRVDHPIRALASSLEHTKPQVAVATQGSLEISSMEDMIVIDSEFDPGTFLPGLGKREIVCDEGAYSAVGFLTGNRMAATTGNQLRVFQRNKNYRMQLRERIQLCSHDVVDLFGVDGNTVVVAYRDGKLEILTLR